MRSLTFVLTAVCLFLATPSSATPKTAKDFIESVAGVYKKRFPNELIDGTKYGSEDILEVVPFGDNAAYVRMELQFFNGHLGGVYGVATFDAATGNTLVYDGPGSSKDRRCIVTYVFTDTHVTTTATYGSKEGDCSGYTGARGTLRGAEWPASAKRKIRYMDHLKKSSQYANAVKEFEVKPKAALTAPQK